MLFVAVLFSMEISRMHYFQGNLHICTQVILYMSLTVSNTMELQAVLILLLKY